MKAPGTIFRITKSLPLNGQLLNQMPGLHKKNYHAVFLPFATRRFCR
jgi:hypothetical protein